MENGARNCSRFLEGDEHALDEILNGTFYGLVFFINRYVRDVHAAEDIAMDAVAELFARPGRLREGVSLKTYLFTMGRSRALNYINRRGKIVFEELPEDGGPADVDADLEEKVLSDEKRRAVNEAVRDLPPDLRDAVWLVYFEEMSYKEAAAVMKKKEKQIDNLIFRAKRELRVKLGEKGVFSE
ncbi:MAG: RNA polymerase sigma factor [Clostridia bacterium]|nr:RNA polymerase sigma factor [Clostridia bacterium]